MVLTYIQPMIFGFQNEWYIPNFTRSLLGPTSEVGTDCDCCLLDITYCYYCCYLHQEYEYTWSFCTSKIPHTMHSYRTGQPTFENLSLELYTNRWQRRIMSKEIRKIIELFHQNPPFLAEKNIFISRIRGWGQAKLKWLLEFLFSMLRL